MDTIDLNHETRATLDRIRHSSRVLSVYEMPADLAEAAVWEIGKVLVANQHLPMIQQHSYRWFLREVAKLMRTKTGWDLALELEISMRKWVAYKLDPLLMQALVRECCDRIAAMTPDQIEERSNEETRMANQARMTEARTAGVGVRHG
jgi:hypothetical protein